MVHAVGTPLLNRGVAARHKISQYSEWLFTEETQVLWNHSVHKSRWQVPGQTRIGLASLLSAALFIFTSRLRR